MAFSSTVFLFCFLPLLLFFYFIVPEKYKNFILFIGSLFFYSWGEPKSIVILIISIIVNYFIGIAISKKDKNKKDLLIWTESQKLNKLEGLF